MKNFSNPVIYNQENRHWTSDPFVTVYNGNYYHIYSDYDGIYISEFQEFKDMETAGRVNVYPFDETAQKDWYAPELHRIEDAWYIYVAPDYGDDLHCMTVLRLQADSPLGQYENLGVIKGLEGAWTIDGTVLSYEEKFYFLWTFGAAIYLQEMQTPWALKEDAQRILLTRAELPFETVTEVKVNEGPAILKRGNKIHVIYSANDSRCDAYCLGKITFQGGDILDTSRWQKYEKAVFESTKEIFGPGHCSFTTAIKNGCTEDYIVYHANLVSGSGWYGRNVFVQKFSWDENDNPVFGIPTFAENGTEQ